VVIALLAAAVLGTLVAVRQGLMRDSLRRWAETAGSELLGAELKIGAIKGELLPELRLRDVELRLDGRRVARIRAIDVRIDFDPALRGEPVVLRSLDASGVQLWLWRTDDGELNVSRLGPREEPVSEAPGAEEPRFTLQIEHADIADAAIEIEDPRGRFQANLRATLAGLTLPLDAAAASSVSGHVDLETAGLSPVTALFAEGRWRIPSTSIDYRGGRIDLEGEGDLVAWLEPDRDAAASVQMMLADFDPAALPGLLWPAGSITGSFVGSVHRRNAGLSGAADLELAPSSVGSHEIERITARLTTNDASWRLIELQIATPTLRLNAVGEGTASEVARLEVTASTTDIGELARMAGTDAAGSLELEATIAGTLAAPVARLDLSAQALEWQGFQLGALSAHVATPSPGRIVVESLTLSGGELSLELDRQAEVSFDGDGLRSLDLALHSNIASSVSIKGSLANGVFSDVRIRADGIDPAVLSQLAQQPVDVAGRIALELELAGPMLRPTGRGSLAWQAPSVEGIELAQVALEFRADAEWIDVSARALHEADRSPLFEIQGRAPWSSAIAFADWQHDPRAHARLFANEVNLAELARFVPVSLPTSLSAASGKLSIDAVARGGADGPDLDGTVRLVDGSIHVPLARQRYEPVDLQLRLARDRISIERFTIGKESARARIEGSIGLEGLALSRIDLRARLERFSISRSSLLRASASGTLALVGPTDALLLDGDLELHDVRATLPDEEDRELREITVLAASSSDVETTDFVERAPRPDIFDRSTVHIVLHVPPGSRFRGRGAEINLQGDLELDKQPGDAPRLTGEAKVVRGHFDFQRRRFDLRRGVVHFDGGPDLADPVIDIEGVYRVRAVSIILRATGRLSDPPTIELEGDPPMTSDEALAYLVFGRPIEELRDSEEGSVRTAASSMAAGMAIDEFSRLIVNTGIVDTIDVEFAEDGSIESLRVGTYIGNKTFVRAGNSFGSKSEQDVHVEYRFTPHISVESQLSTDGTAGADLILRLDY